MVRPGPGTTRPAARSKPRNSFSIPKWAQLGDGAGQLDTGRPAAHHHEGEEPLPLLRVLGRLGPLEGEQQAAADFGRVLDALQPRSMGSHSSRPK